MKPNMEFDIKKFVEENGKDLPEGERRNIEYEFWGVMCEVKKSYERQEEEGNKTKKHYIGAFAYYWYDFLFYLRDIENIEASTEGSWDRVEAPIREQVISLWVKLTDAFLKASGFTDYRVWYGNKQIGKYEHKNNIFVEINW